MLSLIAFLTVAIVILLAFTFLPSHITDVFRATGSRNGRLAFTPTRLSALDITTLILLVFFKYTKKLIGLHPTCKPSPNGKDFSLPSVTLSAPLHVSKSDLENFAIAMESNSDAEGCSPLLLPAITTPLLLIMLSNRHCPIFPFGAVNTRNRFEFRVPMACRDVASLKDATVTARMGGDDLPGQRVKRGMEFEIVVDVEAAMKEGRRLVFRQVIGIMVFLPKGTKPVWEEKEDSTNTARASEISSSGRQLPQQIKLSSKSPKSWARVCKDVNPIHMSSLAGKAFGFPGKIAHGNHVVALVVENQREIEGSLFWQSQRPWFLDVAFKRPMVLPLVLQVEFADETTHEKGKGAFEVMRGDKAHISGVYGEL